MAVRKRGGMVLLRDSMFLCHKGVVFRNSGRFFGSFVAACVIFLCLVNKDTEKKVFLVVRDKISYANSVISYPYHLLVMAYNKVFDYVVNLHYGIDVTSIIAEKHRLRSDIAVIESENAQLRSLLHFVHTPVDFSFITARIVGAVTVGRGQGIVVSAGSSAGITSGAVVASGSGIIGRVYNAGKDFSIIIPVTHRDFNVSCIVVSHNNSTPGVRFIVHGGAGPHGLMRITYMNNVSILDDKNKQQQMANNILHHVHDNDVFQRKSGDVEEKEVGEMNNLRDGDLAVTSGEIGTIPYGIPVGKVVFIDGMPFVKSEGLQDAWHIVRIYIKLDERINDR